MPSTDCKENGHVKNCPSKFLQTCDVVMAAARNLHNSRSQESYGCHRAGVKHAKIIPVLS